MTEAELDSLVLAGKYNPAHLKSKTFEMEEILHRRKLKRRFLGLWASVGNIALAVTVVALLVLPGLSLPAWSALVGAGAVIASIIGSVALLYRQHLTVRDAELQIRKLRQLAREYQMEEAEEAAKNGNKDDGETLLLVHKRYREDVPEVVESYRRESNKYRRMSNTFQNTIIVGSLLASSATTSSVYFEGVRWVAVAISLLVAVAAGFIAYYKYRERSFNLQQAADSIERNYYSVELRAGKYMQAKDEKSAYHMFVNEVEFLREEQSKRQQQLEQPSEVKQDQQS